jgi:hypothetical protein
MTNILPVYPNGSGHYALGTPDGVVLRSGVPVLVVLAGQQIPGHIRWSERGDFFEAADQSICGLYPAMQVAVATSGQAARQRQSYRPRFCWTVLRQQILIERCLMLSLTSPRAKKISLCTIGRRIAEEQSWPELVVRSKLYQLRGTIEQRRQHLLQQRHILELRQQRSTQPPVQLARGVFLWSVFIQSGSVRRKERQSWLLDYTYGNCPLLPGQRCLYGDQCYVVEQVWCSQLSVSIMAASPEERQAAHV